MPKNPDPRKELEKMLKIHAKLLNGLSSLADASTSSKTTQQSLRVAYNKTFEAKIATLHAVAAVETDYFESNREKTV
jgi:hypothetical protein